MDHYNNCSIEQIIQAIPNNFQNFYACKVIVQEFGFKFGMFILQINNFLHPYYVTYSRRFQEYLPKSGIIQL